jgi:hypothetical protein
MDAEKQKLMEEVALRIKEINEIDLLEQMLKDNINEFIFKDQHYRVRKPTPPEKEQANKERMIRYIAFLKDPAYMFRKQIVALCKAKGVDIDAMEFKMKQLGLQEHELYKRLDGNQDPADIELLEKEILSVQEQQKDVFLEKEELLKYCIEKQLDDFLKFYLVYLVLEVYKNDKWNRVYMTYEEFMESPDEILQAKAAQILALMINNESI